MVVEYVTCSLIDDFQDDHKLVVVLVELYKVYLGFTMLVCTACLCLEIELSFSCMYEAIF